jgi:hypothetical protein
MSELTRVVRLRPDIDRGNARNERTVFARIIPDGAARPADHGARFNHHQRRLSQLVRDYMRPGLAVFALHEQYGFVGHVWLEASEAVRSATLGRHSRADLHLPDEPSLSLRHLLVLVHRRDGVTHVRVLDLMTPAGFKAEGDDVLRGLEADGLLVFSAAGYTFLAVPTGAGIPWDVSATDPWQTLPPREARTSVRRLPTSGRRASVNRNGETRVTAVPGPVVAGSDGLLADGEAPEGTLHIRDGDSRTQLVLGASALARGVVLGRYERCAGAVAVESDRVSRVHAVLVEVAGQVHLVDAGSTNGTTLDGEDVRCAAVLEGRWYELGSMWMSWSTGR